MSGVAFSIGNNLNDDPNDQELVIFYDSLINFLYRDFASITNRCDLSIRLDEYNDKLFLETEVNELIGICELLIQRYCYPQENWRLKQASQLIKDLHHFLESLKALCIKAVYKNSLICLWGN